MTAAPASPAGFWKRSVAYSLDVIVLSLVFQGVLSVGLAFFAGHDVAWLLGLLERAHALQDSGDLDGVRQLWSELGPWLWRATWVSTLVYALVGAAYFAGMEASPWQATLGKRLLGLHVVTRNGRRIGPGRALLRYFAAGISWVFLNLGHAMAAWTPDKRALHDYIADTRVDNVDPRNAAMPLWGWLLIGVQVGIVLLFGLGCAVAVAIAVSRMGQI
jgi:uncharacterized RDD family membrane protein YckC